MLNSRTASVKSDFFGGKSLTPVFRGEYNQSRLREIFVPPAKLLGFDNAAEVAGLRVFCRTCTELALGLVEEPVAALARVRKAPRSGERSYGDLLALKQSLVVARGATARPVSTAVRPRLEP